MVLARLLIVGTSAAVASAAPATPTTNSNSLERQYSAAEKWLHELNTGLYKEKKNAKGQRRLAHGNYCPEYSTEFTGDW